MWNSPASLSLKMLRAVFSRMASIREDTSGNLGGGGGGYIILYTLRTKKVSE